MPTLRFSSEDLLWVPPAVLLALSTASSRALNLAWIALFLTTMVLFVLRFALRRHRISDAGMAPAARTLAFYFAAGFVLKLLAQAYWGELGPGITFELNALVASVLVLALVRLQIRHVPTLVVWLALAGFAGVALKTAIDLSLVGDAVLPTNAVNWAAGLALMLCLSAGLVLFYRPFHMGWYLSMAVVLALVLAVFFSSKRGSFFAILWVLMLGLTGLIRSPASTARRPAHYLGLVGAMVVLSGVIWLSPALVKRPIDYLVLGANEASNFAKASEDKNFVPKGSMDTRLYIYRRAADQIAMHPLMGLGPQGKLELVRSMEGRLQVPLFHLHSEPLDAWVAYGIPGFLSTLMFPLGLVLAGRRLRPVAPGSALMLVGIGLSHFFSGLSNVNTFHNFYQTMFAVAVVLPFLLFPMSSERRGRLPGE